MITKNTRTVQIQKPEHGNSLDAQLKKATGIGFSYRWEWFEEKKLYCKGIDTMAWWE